MRHVWLAAGVLFAIACHLPAQTGEPTSPGSASQSGAMAFGSITGLVLDTAGDLVSGAAVTLAMQGEPMRSALTGSDGRFAFQKVPVGNVNVTVKFSGFDTAVYQGTVSPGQELSLPKFALQMSSVNFTVNAVLPPELLAQQQLHAQEQQRLIGLFPNFFVSYAWKTPPLTPRQKFSLATHNAIDPGNIFLAGTTAGVQQADNAFPGYHQGAEGYAKRFGADIANLEVGTYMGGAVLPTLFHQDPRYFYKGTGTIRSRFFYAASRAVIARGDNGKWQPAFASVLGDLSAGAISNIYYPASSRQGAGLTLENGFLGVAGDALNDVFQEFILKKLTTKLRNASSNSTSKQQ